MEVPGVNPGIMGCHAGTAGGVWQGRAPKPGGVGRNGILMVILFFYAFLMSLPLPSTAGRGRQERGRHGGWWQGTKQRDLLSSRP